MRMTPVLIVGVALLLPGAAPAQVGGKGAARAQVGGKTGAQRLTPVPATLRSLDAGLEPVQFNPKEISIDRSVRWKRHERSKSDAPMLEFANAAPMVLGMEIFFDEYESRRSVYDVYVSKLEALASAPKGEDRPPMCLFTWGDAFPPFKGVVTSLSVKYTTFLTDGTPVRAEVKLELEQAEKLAIRQPKSAK